MRAESPAPPWWVDLVHPVPLGAAAILFINDHALKGAGLLPGWLTGKLSDVTGLFVLPVVLVACLRWGAGALGRPAGRGGAPAWAAVGGVGALFAAMKLSPAVNRWMNDILGPNSMDPGDLAALVALVPSGLWMSRNVSPRAPAGTPAVRTAAAAFAALACVATSKKAEPLPPRPQPVAVPARQKECASLTAVTCRYDRTRFAVRVSAKLHDSQSCRARIGGVTTEGVEGAAAGVIAEAPVVELGQRDAVLLAAWGRLGKAGQSYERARVSVDEDGRDAEGPVGHRGMLEVACRAGFGEDTQPPAEVAR